MTDLWPHQAKALSDIDAAHREGHRRILVTSPTGGGKSLIMTRLIMRFLAEGLRVSLYTNRKMLLDQLSKVCSENGIFHGIRAAGYDDDREHRFQISSIQTEHSRCIKTQRWNLHPGNLVIVDEAHLHTGDMANTIMARHRDQGALVVGFTATPVDMGLCYDTLVQAGTVSELQKCGALVPAVHYAPDEPELRGHRDDEMPSAAKRVSAIMRDGLIGRIWENFERINPEHKPTICFGPDVDGGIYIAEKFTARGVRAAFIGGQEIWIDGERHPSTRQLREEILSESKKGSVKVICNRFVMREGIDCPWLFHAILACIFGALQSYLQSGGRLLRAYPGMENVTIQDHGGNYWRHGSLNEDRYWSLDDTDSRLRGNRADSIRKDPKKEPFTCPRCHRVWMAGRRCNPARGGCGFEFPEKMKRSRVVVTREGKLKMVEGRIFKERRQYKLPDGPQKWEKMYYRAKSKKWDASFKQAFAMFAHENYGQWPDQSWPLMPLDNNYTFHKVSEVAVGNLIPKPERTANAQ